MSYPTRTPENSQEAFIHMTQGAHTHQLITKSLRDPHRILDYTPTGMDQGTFGLALHAGAAVQWPGLQLVTATIVTSIHGATLAEVPLRASLDTLEGTHVPVVLFLLYRSEDSAPLHLHSITSSDSVRECEHEVDRILDEYQAIVVDRLRITRLKP